MALQPAQSSSGSSGADKACADKKKQMCINDQLRKHIGDILHADLMRSEPQMCNVLFPPRSRLANS
jgi:hypothetical protein